MNLNEFLVINAKTKLDDLSIMINELNVLNILLQKAIFLKKSGIKNEQYKIELLDFLIFEAGTVNVNEFMKESNDISLIDLCANMTFLSDENINHKLSGVFYLDQEYWNDDKKEKFKAKILVINNRINTLSHRLLYLFFIS